MPQPVTVGLDGSPASRAAAEWAAHEAELRGLPLRLLHAADPDTAVPRGPGHPARDPAGSHRWAWAEHMMRETRETVSARHPGLPVLVEQVPLDPPTALGRAVADGGLLVVGGRGPGALTGLPLGSVSLAVSARAAGPVVVVRAEEERRRVKELQREGLPEPEVPQGDVVVGLDVDRPHEAPLRFAFETAHRRGTGVFVLYGWTVPPHLRDLSDELTEAQDTAELTRAALEKLDYLLRPWQERYPGTAVREGSVAGGAGRYLVGASREAALVVVGRGGGARGVGAHLGPVSHAVLHYAMSPVAVVPHG